MYFNSYYFLFAYHLKLTKNVVMSIIFLCNYNASYLLLSLVSKYSLILQITCTAIIYFVPMFANMPHNLPAQSMSPIYAFIRCLHFSQLSCELTLL